MIVFEWFYDKNEIIVKQLQNELIQFKNYKVNSCLSISIVVFIVYIYACNI